MCKFCDLLYSEKQADNKRHQEWAADLVYYDNDGELNIQVDTGDPWETGILRHITYCPFCGRNLKELYGHQFINGVLKEHKEMTEDDKRKLFYAEVLLKSVSGDDPAWLALEPCMWPMLKEALSDYVLKMKENKR